MNTTVGQQDQQEDQNDTLLSLLNASNGSCINKLLTQCSNMFKRSESHRRSRPLRSSAQGALIIGSQPTTNALLARSRNISSTFEYMADHNVHRLGLPRNIACLPELPKKPDIFSNYLPHTVLISHIPPHIGCPRGRSAHNLVAP